ncbi:phospholipase-like protein [Tanacetum coccineum]
MDGINIDDLTIEQYLMFTQEHRTPSMVKKVDDMIIAEYDMELDEEVGYTTDDESVMSEHEAINPVHAVNIRSLEEELSSKEDLDEWLNAKMEKHMSMQEEKNDEDALIAIIKSIREKSNIDAGNNVMPRSIYEYMQLANLGGAAMSVEMDHMTQQETLGTVKNVMVKINKFEFPCDFVVTEILENLGEMIILGRPFLETIHAQIDDTRNYDNNDPQNEISGQTNPLLDKGGLTKRWHVCKPVHVFYDDGSGEDCGMWPTCDPDLNSCYGYSEVFGKSEQANREYLDNGFDVEEEYANKIGNPYSQRFNEYKRVFDNEVENLSNEYTLRIGKKGYVLDDVWEKCEQYHKKVIDSWHDVGNEEKELWRSGDEKTDYEPPFMDIKTFEVKKYSFERGRSFICITKQDDDVLPLGRVNRARFKAMIRNELRNRPQRNVEWA